MLDPVPPNPCPDFDLAEPIALDPRLLLVTEDDDDHAVATKELTLLLALAFNDFKLLAWTQEQLGKGKPLGSGVSAYGGQWAGMTISLNRLAAGLLWEITGVIRKHGRIIEGADDVRAAIRFVEKLSPSAARAWHDLLSIAQGHRQHASMHTFYKEIRNSFAFHYKSGGRALLEAYRQHFTEMREDPAHTSAYVSLGESMEMTRFYFADAAAQRAFSSAQKQLGIESERLLDVGRDVNVALRFVIGALLERLKARLEAQKKE